ncbi:protein-export chaperone SecB [Corynebacterium sp. p3-SID1194]|uniref:protein-export chaperone SecB n=1 Tax=Corynebacterium sp. p3-SID1194 TaxID=2916105 RepID=UPI0021A2954A|nr:protein-export chaperone SecB [Corynebacterium sp. p3-SID1194]MCT1450407.1 protein-export chaperone SecB [Corynebacterium sp. p3-SID1194]
MPEAKDHSELRVRAGEIAGTSNLFDVRLVQSTARLERVPSPDAQLSVSVEMTPSGSISLDAGTNGLLLINADFTVTIVDAGNDSEPVASVECTFVAAFEPHMDSEPAQEALDAFAETTGLFAIYPYAREYISDATRRMGLPALVLDLLKR